jgi:thiol-disulfide isomerase/thioredoxin
VTKPLLYVAITLAGIGLGIFHYKLKPAPSDKDLREYAQTMSGGAEWRNQIAPDFELKTTSGEDFKLSENVGKKIIVLNFFATWCGPCREEMPELNRYFNDHKSESFLLVGIDSEEKQDRVDGFLKDLKIDFPAGIDDGPIQKQYGVTAFPTTVLIGVDGKVQFYESGALANADVAFSNLLAKNRQLMDAGQVISPQDYRLLAQKQTALPVAKGQEKSTSDEEAKLDSRGTRIVARMDCPCGCEKKVQICTCNTSKKIKTALASEDYKDQPDDEIVKSLNKRFCSGAM